MATLQNFKILLPIDVTHPHPEFFDVLDDLLSLKDKSVQLLYVREELPAYENLLTTLNDKAEDLQEQIVSRVNQVFAPLVTSLEAFSPQVSTKLVAGPTTIMIEAVARDDKFDLMAVAPGTKPSVERFFLGSTSARLVAHAPCPLLLLRGTAKSLKTLVIGLDGSTAAMDGLKKAYEIFNLGQRAVKIVLVNAVNVKGVFKYLSPTQFVGAIEDNLLMAGEAILAEGKNVLSELGAKDVETVLKEGEPASVLLDVAEQSHAELIAVSAQGKGAVERMLVGSVSSRLAAHATTSVAIFR